MPNTTIGVTLAAGMDISNVLSGVKAMQGAFNGLKMPPHLMDGMTKEFNNLQKLIGDYQKAIEKKPTSKADIKNVDKMGNAIISSFNRLIQMQNELSNTTIISKVDSSQLDALREKTKAAKDDVAALFAGVKVGNIQGDLSKVESSLEKAVNRSKTLKQSFSEAFSSLKTGDVNQFTNSIDKMFQDLSNKVKAGKLIPSADSLIAGFKDMGLIDINLKTDSAAQKLVALKNGFTELKTAIASGVDNQKLQELVKVLDDATSAERNFKAEAERRGQESLQNRINETNQLRTATEQVTKAERDFQQQTLSAAQQVQQLQQSTQYFFSLRNMINLLKRGVRDAIDTVKELDAAMTETAVVTDFSVGDMWEKLPEYTANANALGATVQDMYEATTLYYQQGLDADQAMGIAAETMKMARIGGLEAADATDKMTAALRGFNMELNETSAKRVNDVYSNLAAKTASDTEELGSAMQRTASIAANAGMSFEGTAAFLAQAIETTREPAENIGTAMKTIIARMQEMKKNPMEIGEVDGEEVDYNKIDAALKSVGISLKEANGSFRDNDEVLLDISQHWNSLTQTQQRYIATTIAGSRQQSRFIAMVGDYERTMQLMEYANNSAGASEEQFGKTMEGLEAKLNKLKNAWERFEMGIAGNSIIKGVVDGLTGILNVTNKLIDTLSLGSNTLKSFLSIFAAFTGLKAMGRIANRAIGGLGGLLDPQSSFKEGFTRGGIKNTNGVNAAQAKAINQPIVNVCRQILGAINKKAINDYKAEKGPKSFGEYKKTLQNFRGIANTKGSKINGAFASLKGLSAQQVQSIIGSNPGTTARLQRGLYDELGKGLSRQLIDSLKQGKINGDQLSNLNKSNIGQALGTKQAQEFSRQFNNTIASQMRNVFAGQISQIRGDMWSKNPELAMATAGLSHQEALKNIDYQNYMKERIASYQQANREWYKKQASFGDNLIPDATAADKTADAIGKVGSAAMTAGQGCMALGNMLNDLGFEEAGAAASAFGNTLSSLGQMANAIPSLITAFSNPITAAITGITVVAAAGLKLYSSYIKKIKTDAEKVTSDFTNKNQEAQKNIATLKSYREELATLSKGVDSNGNNVSLDDSQYQRYLEIVDDIAKINPEIVQGYNAQGHAIVNINTALSETIKKQEQIKQGALETYTQEESLQKLINARNINKDYKQTKSSQTGVSTGATHGNEDDTHGLTSVGKRVPLAGDVSSIADKLSIAGGFKPEMLEKYGIESLEALQRGEEQAVKNFVKHRERIEADLSNAGVDLSENVLKGFDKLGEDAAAFDEAIKPVYDNLLTSVSNSKLYETIPDEFKGALQTGLKELAGQDLSASEMMKAANNMTARFANLANGSGKYKDALDIATKAQDKFAQTLDETEYKADVQPAINDLMRLKEEALNEGTAYGDALAEYLENQIERISNFTQEGGANLTEALNTATDEIAAAEGALDNFNNATKKDFATAAEGMKSIFEKTTETFQDSYGTEIQKHAEGLGDMTFWTGAETMLSEKAIKNITDNAADGYEAAEKVSAAIKSLEPMLREGQEGFDAFTDRVLENSDALDKLKGVEYDKETGLLTKIPDEQWHNVAEALGISDDLLTSMLNKGRQFADISFMNVDDARKALAASDYTIKGSGTTNGQKNLYVKEETMRAELSAAGYVHREQQDEQISKLLEKGVKTIPAADEISTSDLKGMASDWGVKTLPDLIQKLNDTGNFTKDEIQAYADKLGMLGDEGKFDSLYSDIIEAAQNPELAKQTSVLETISAQVGALIDKRTGSQAEKDYKKAHKALVGGEGVDTEAQAFAYGKKLNEDGTLGGYLNAGEYEETKKSLESVAQSYKENAAIAAQHVKTTTGAEKKHWKAVQKGYEEDAARVEKYLAMGAKAFNKYSDELDKEVEAKKSKDEGRKQEQKKQQEADKKSKAETEGKARERQGQNEAKKHERSLTEAEGRKAQNEARKHEYGENYRSDLEARDKGRTQERNQEKQLSDLRQKEITGRKAEIEGRQQGLQAERQLQRQKELEARSIGREQELSMAQKLESERAGRQKEITGRNEGKQATTAANIDTAQSQIDFLVSKNINNSLKNALTNLDPNTIATDPTQQQALSNIYKNLINDRLPKVEDLQSLGLYNQLDSGYQNQLEQASKSLGNKIKSAYAAWDEANGYIPNVGLAAGAGGEDPITKSITTLGQRIKNWWDKIHGLNAGANQGSQTPEPPAFSPQQTIQHDQEQGMKRTQQFKPQADTSELEKAKTVVDDLTKTLSTKANFKIHVTGVPDLTKAASAAQKVNKAQGDKNFSVSASVSGIPEINAFVAAANKTKGLRSKALLYSAIVTGTSDTEAGYSAGINFQSLHDHTVTYTTEYKTVGSPGGRPKATGAHNHGYVASPSFGSAASGYGQIGPKGKGGLTLTGELGYEIAWLPSENRSIILGANGPQMINLPGDAVVWTHEQSEKILKQKGIPAGSHASMSASSYRKKYVGGSSGSSSSFSGGSGSSGSAQSSGSGSDEEKKSQKINHFSIYEIIRFDNDQYLAVLSSEISKRTKSIEKSLKKIGIQANSIRSTIQQQVAALEKVKQNNQDNLNAYRNEINDFLSQQALATWTDSNGESQERKFDIRSFIGEANGTYAIDWRAIQRTAGSREEQEAIYKELEPIKNLTDGLIKAQEAIDDANEQIEKLGEQLAEQFYNWKSELTEIYDLSQRITDQESLRSRFTSQINLELSKLSAGFGTATEAIEHMTAARERDNKTVLKQIENQQVMIAARQRELNRALDASDELATLNAYKNRGYSTASEKNAAVAWAQGEYDAARVALQYVKDIKKDRDGSVQYTIDWAAFDRQQAANPYSKDTYDKIKEYLDNLNSAAEEFNNSIKTQTETIAQLYDDLKEYQDFIGSFEDTLIKTIESDIEQQLENAKRLSDSITAALKDLLDQVKRKLDERRQAEDNAKTEADIAKKQQRLAMLQANSAGGNQVEIAQLQKEIADAQQSYQRTLEDQLLNKLQQQGDDAAKQREHQIELQKAQLEVEKETNKELVNLWLSNPEEYKNEIRDAWLEAQGYEDKGIAGQAVLESEFESEFAKLGLAIEETNYKNGFEDISGDTSTLVGLLTKLTNGEDAGTDPLSKAVGALEDITKRNTESFELSKKAQQSAAAWKNEGITAKDLRAWNYTFKELKDSGFTNADLKNAGFTLSEFQQGGVTKASDLRGAGFSVAELKNAKYNFKQLQDAGFSLAQLRQGGFNISDFMANGIKDAKSLKGAGFTAANLRGAKFSSAALRGAGFTASELLKGGYSAKDLRTGGYTSAQAKGAGISAAGLKGAGYSYADAKKSGYTLQQLYSGGYGEAYWEIWPYGRISDSKRTLYYGDRGNDVKALQWALNKILGTRLSINGVYDDATWDAVSTFEYQAYTSKYGEPTTGDNYIGPEAKSEFRKRGFKTGGIADFTGPAWLDGTPSKPELVLNAQDTKNFLALKDVLRGAMSSIGSVKGSSYGDMTYEININVDHINNDYDVDRIAERVKKNIVKDASYRNVTQVRNFR